MFKGLMTAIFGFASAFLVCCMDTEVLPAWYLPTLLICGALTMLFGWAWYREEEWDD